MSKNLRKAALVAALALAVSVGIVQPAHAATVKFFHRTESQASGIRVYPNASCAGSTYATVARGSSVGGIGSVLVGETWQLTVVKGLYSRRYNLNGPNWSQNANYDCIYIGGQGVTAGYAAFRR